MEAVEVIIAESNALTAPFKTDCSPSFAIRLLYTAVVSQRDDAWGTSFLRLMCITAPNAIHNKTGTNHEAEIWGWELKMGEDLFGWKQLITVCPSKLKYPLCSTMTNLCI